MTSQSTFYMTSQSTPNLAQFFVCFARYLTVLYFLNDVPNGGETAFPVADNVTFDEKVVALTT